MNSKFNHMFRLSKLWLQSQKGLMIYENGTPDENQYGDPIGWQKHGDPIGWYSYVQGKCTTIKHEDVNTCI